MSVTNSARQDRPGQDQEDLSAEVTALRQRIADLEARLAETGLAETGLAETGLAEAGRSAGLQDGGYRDLVDMSPDGILVVSRRRLVFANPAALRILGAKSADEVIGKPAVAVVRSDLRLLATQSVTGVVRDGTVHPQIELVLVGVDGRVFEVEISACPFEYQGEDAVLALFRDITGRKALEAQLREAQKLKSLGQLTGGIAHDFNNLLAVIMGNADLLLDRLGNDDELAQEILRSAQRGAELTQQLLAYSRNQPLRPKSLDLDDLVSGMAAILARTLGETIQIDIQPTPDLWPAEADPGQVENALLNLALNARDAMPGGGRLSIETANVHIDPEQLTAEPDALPGDYVMLAVTDDGTGIASGIIDQVFEPFFTTKDVGAGSGLGLSMVYGFAKQTGGHAAVYSQEGQGTTLRLYLPRARDGVAQAAAPADDDRIPLGRGETILVLEDDPSVRDLTVTMMKKLGYRVLQADSGGAALRVLAAHPELEFLLSDVVLPGGMSGPALAAKARISHPRLKVLFMSGYTEKAIQDRGELPANAPLIGKPFRKASLARKVREVLDSAQVAAK